MLDNGWVRFRIIFFLFLRFEFHIIFQNSRRRLRRLIIGEVDHDGVVRGAIDLGLAVILGGGGALQRAAASPYYAQSITMAVDDDGGAVGGGLGIDFCDVDALRKVVAARRISGKNRGITEGRGYQSCSCLPLRDTRGFKSVAMAAG